MLGERLSRLVSFEGLKLAAAVVILSPYVPLLFMGEEYGEEAPFLYFVSHSDPDLIEAVRKGRREEFIEFNWQGEPPDPQSLETFLQSKIDWKMRKKGRHRILLDFYKKLIGLRNETPALYGLYKKNLDVWGLENERAVFMTRWNNRNSGRVFCMFNFNQSSLNLVNPFPRGRWKKILDSSDKIWDGPGASLPDEMKSQGNGFRIQQGSDNERVIIKGLGAAVYVMSE
jgi:maltooligosyltrehalose trehalohydrolase